MLLDKLQHRLDAVGVAQCLFRHGLHRRSVADQLEDHLRQRRAGFELVAGDFVHHRAERPLHVLDGLVLPVHRGAQHGAGTAGVGQQRLQIFLPEHAVRVAAHQPWVEHHAVQAAAARIQRPIAVQHPCVDEQPLALFQAEFLAACRRQDHALADDQYLQFLVPVPRHGLGLQIVVITGDGEGGGAMLHQLPRRIVHGRSAQRQCHFLLASVFGEIVPRFCGISACIFRNLMI